MIDDFKPLPLEIVEAKYIIKILKHFNWNRTHAAIALGISLRCLRMKISQFKKSGIEIPESSELKINLLSNKSILNSFIDELKKEI